MTIRPNRGGIRPLSIEKDSYRENLLIVSDREKNSASNKTIFNESDTNNSGLLGQKLIFPSFKSTQDVPYFPMNIEKQCYIHDQHILFYRSIKITNETKKKKFFRIPGGDLRHQKLTYSEMSKKM